MIKTITTIFIILIFLTTTFGQKNESMEWKKLSYNESISLSNYWNVFKNAIVINDTFNIRNLSLSKIDCDLCVSNNIPNTAPKEDYIISIDSFLIKDMNKIIESQLWFALKTRGYNATFRTIHNYQRRNLPEDYGKDLTIYEIWIQTYLPNEWAEDHEGQSHAFQFIKYKNKFKFYGIASIP